MARASEGSTRTVDGGKAVTQRRSPMPLVGTIENRTWGWNMNGGYA
jgi:hypothetical protein